MMRGVETGTADIHDSGIPGQTRAGSPQSPKANNDKECGGAPSDRRPAGSMMEEAHAANTDSARLER